MQPHTEQDTLKKDFFISYTSVDRAWAEWIAWQLEEARYPTILQAWDFRPGNNFVLAMDRAAREAKRTIAVLSPDYLKGSYTQAEWAAAFRLDPTSERGILIPVHVRECRQEIKKLLGSIIYINLARTDESTARERLLEGVLQERVKPSLPPHFPGEFRDPQEVKPLFPGVASTTTVSLPSSETTSTGISTTLAQQPAAFDSGQLRSTSSPAPGTISALPQQQTMPVPIRLLNKLSQLPVKVKVGLLILLVIFLFVRFVPLPFSLPTPLCNILGRPCPSVAHGTPLGNVTPLDIGVTKVGNEYIGISDGRFPFDIGKDRPDGSFKLQAAKKLKVGDIRGAKSSWRLGLQQKAKNGAPETNDAEALIYLEDQRVLASGHPYITFVVATFLTGDNVKIGRDNLQGAYTAQLEFNSNPNFELPNGVLVRLLIANSGSADSADGANAARVAQQIVQAAQRDHTIVGVMGWPYSQSSINAVKVLAAAHIPMVSQTASSTSLTKISPYFFRVNPTDKQQGAIGAQYAEQMLQAKRVALFVDPSNPYSKSLAQAFCQAFTLRTIANPNDFCQGPTQNGNAIVAVEPYMVKDPETVVGTPEKPNILEGALNTAPDLIYLAGYAPEARILLDQLAKDGSALKVMGGDALYDLKKYPSDGYPTSTHNRLYFTEFAYPDEWQGVSVQRPSFFEDYSSDFDPSKHYSDNSTYGYNRASAGVMLSYDAMLALLNASKIALAGGRTIFGSSDLQHALTEITGKQAIQGISGQISFGPNGNPIDKAIVVLRIEKHGYTIMLSKQCRFLLTDAPQPQCVNPTL